jgi:hypothetical protein
VAGREEARCVLEGFSNAQGFLYKMRTVYAHFPINCIIQEEGRAVEIRNFLGEKVLLNPVSHSSLTRLTPLCLAQIVRHVNMLNGVTVEESKAQKDELILIGNDIDMVSQSGAHRPHSRGSIFDSFAIPQLHLFRAHAEYETRISGNSWTAFMSRRGGRWRQRKLVP